MCSILDLVPYFEGRYIREDSHWQKTLFPKLQSFLISNARQNDHLRIIIDAHVSISFSVGAVLNVKSGKRIEIEQRATGRFFWSIDDTPIDPSWPKLTFDEETVAGQDGAIAIAISLTHDVSPAVRAYIAQNQLPITKIFHSDRIKVFRNRSVPNGPGMPACLPNPLCKNFFRSPAAQVTDAILIYSWLVPIRLRFSSDSIRTP